MNQQAESILREVKKAIVGKDEVVARALMVVLSRGQNHAGAGVQPRDGH